MKISILCTALALAPVLAAQTPDSRPKFDVASVKECKPGDQPPPSTNSPLRLSLSCWPLWLLISDAYSVFAAGKSDPTDFLPPPVEGPRWIQNTRYTIDATTEGPVSAAVMRGPMMQRLLEERFQLELRRDTLEVPVYFLTVAKDGIKAPPTPEGACRSADPTDLTQSFRYIPDTKPWCALPHVERSPQAAVYTVSGVPLAVFFNKMMIPGRPVIDRNGLTELYDIRLAVDHPMPGASQPDGAASDPGDTTVVNAVRKQLGLELTPGKGPHEFLVVDRVERPSAN